LALGQAAAFAVLAETGITNAGPSVITGNVGANVPHTSITGFAETLDPDTGVFSTSTQVTGKIFATDYHTASADELDLDPSLVGRDLATDVSDMGLAYTDAAGRKPVPPLNLNLGGGNISGSLNPGLYKWTTALNVGSITLLATSPTPEDRAKDAWIFQIAGDLNVANGAVVAMSNNGALAKNVFWQVGGQATLGAGSTFQGTILSNTQIVLQNSVTMTGRALAKTQVTLGTTVTVTKP